MNKTWLVLSHEVETIVRSRSFILTLILVPLVGFIVLFVVGILQRNNPSPDITSILTPERPSLKGFVDLSQIIQDIPSELKTQIRAYPDQDAGLNALKNGEIAVLYIVSPNYLESGKIEMFAQQINLLEDTAGAYPVDWLIEYNLLKDQPQLLERVVQPLNLTVELVAAEKPPREQNDMLTFFIPYGITLFFYIFILGSASLLLSNITTEKQNRVMEILLTSVTPTQMMTGKIIGLGLVGLLQMVVWLISALLLLQFSGRTFTALQGVEIPPAIIGWGVLFFILGYTIFAALMAGIGALVPNLREASQATFLVILPLIIPLMFISLLINRPDSPVALILSLFPLTSPVAMMTRLAAAAVPLWQLGLAAILQALAALLIIRLVSGMFRAQNLLSGQPFSLKVFLQALVGRT
ncbi:MAG: sodium transporter [Bellilinea sp.]|nr:MAG: sodium transporter [Bellilinea sp.]